MLSWECIAWVAPKLRNLVKPGQRAQQDAHGWVGDCWGWNHRADDGCRRDTQDMLVH